MKELRPIDTFFLAIATIAILVGVSFVSPPDDALFGVIKIDLFSALKEPTEAFATGESVDDPLDDYSVDYVRNDIVSNKTKRDTAARRANNPNTTSTSSKVIIERDSLRSIVIAAGNGNSNGNGNGNGNGNSSGYSSGLMVTPDSSPALSTHPVEPQKAKHPTEQKSFKLEGEGGTGIENSSALAPFFAKLRTAINGSRPVRIAVLGDSFIEGDIFTQDLREMFQDRFGGQGVGFIPMASSVAGFRQTITHNFTGWTTHCIATAARRGNYTLSPYTFTASDGSISRYATTFKRRHIESFSRARLLFVNASNTTIGTKINGVTTAQHSPAASQSIQQLVVEGDSITSVEFSFRSTDSFTAYGVFLDGTNGVAVDNYSVRGNSGVSLASTSIDLMTQVNSLLPVDLIILEYGLNVAGADNRNYDQYQTQMKNAIAHLQQAFPTTAILILGVADRAHRTAAGWQTMPGIRVMDRTQRQLAAQCGVAFWSTMKNMQGLGGMGKFVDKGWAAKDYTHLSHKGGRIVARSLFDAFMVEYGN